MSDFIDKTRATYGSMARRVSKKSAMRFSLAEYRGWVAGRLGSDGSGECQCVYCNCWLNLATMIPDHQIPLSRGGRLCGVENLAPVCERCNDIKGELTHDEYNLFLDLIGRATPYIQTNVLERLAKAEKLAGMVRLRKPRGKKPQTLYELFSSSAAES
jgi:5-methylcytosine-specific restriction endonuclease McrA